MGNGRGFARRAAVAIALGVGLFAVSGGGASAAVSLPQIVNGKADAIALRIRLTLAKDLALGLPNPLGKTTTIEQVISLTNGVVKRTATGTGLGKGFATVGSGLLDLGTASSQCPGARCGVNEAVEGIKIALPGDLGTVSALGGSSTTRSIIDTVNNTALVKVQLNPLGQTVLKPVAEALQQVVDVVNENVVPVGDSLLQTLKETIITPVFKELPQEIQDAVTIGKLGPISNVVTSNLLSLVIKEAQANVQPVVVGGREAIRAVSSANIADISVLGGFVKLGAAHLSTTATASGVKGGAAADAVSDVVDLRVGELLGVHITPETLDFIANRLDETIDQVAALREVLEIVEQTAGLSIERFGTSKFVDPNGFAASATAGTLKIVVEPKLPDVASLADALTAGIDSSKVKYQSLGVKLSVELPASEAAVSVGKVKDIPPFRRPSVTGLGTTAYAIVGLGMLGAAVLVRKFALSR